MQQFLLILPACFSFGDGSFSHGCTRIPEDLLRFLETSGREELRILQTSEISLTLPPVGGSDSTVSKGAPQASSATVVTVARGRADDVDVNSRSSTDSKSSLGEVGDDGEGQQPADVKRELLC